MMKEGRYKPFYVAGVEMKKLGLSYPDIQTELEGLSRTIGKGESDWVSSAIESLRTYKKGFNREAG